MKSDNVYQYEEIFSIVNFIDSELKIEYLNTNYIWIQILDEFRSSIIVYDD